MRKQTNIFQNIDWITVLLYFILIFAGWINIFAAVYNEDHNSIFDVTQNYGKQFVWISTAFVLGMTILIIDGKFYAAFSYLIYGISILSLIAVLFFGKDVQGSKSWLNFGTVSVQPAEFAKFDISPRGFHWYRLDVDVSIAGLLTWRCDMTRGHLSTLA